MEKYMIINKEDFEKLKSNTKKLIENTIGQTQKINEARLSEIETIEALSTELPTDESIDEKVKNRVRKYLNKYFKSMYLKDTDSEFKSLVRIINKLATEQSLIEQMKAKEKWIKTKDKIPSLNDEYLVVWDLEDNEHPVVASMDFDTNLKCFIDPRGTNRPIDADKIIYWSELPKPPKIDKKEYKHPLEQITTTIDDMERLSYGQCVHGENLESCKICNH